MYTEHRKFSVFKKTMRKTNSYCFTATKCKNCAFPWFAGPPEKSCYYFNNTQIFMLNNERKKYAFIFRIDAKLHSLLCSTIQDLGSTF